MTGEPPDIDGACNARLWIGDNYGDGTATMVCHLPPGHEPEPHREEFDRDGGKVIVTWERDERQRCDHCGKWEHQCETFPVADQERCPRYRTDHDWETCPICERTLA